MQASKKARAAQRLNFGSPKSAKEELVGASSSLKSL